MGTSPTIISLLLNCQWFKCVCDFINKNNGVIGLIIIILLCFGLYKMKNKTSDIKLRAIVLLNIFALAFSVMALCMTHPNQLGFDYIGAIVGILALLVTILIGWNIYTIIDIKKIRKEYNIVFRHKIKEYSKQIEEKSKAQIVDYQIATNINDAIYYYKEKQYDDFIRSIANVLYFLREIENEDKVIFCVNRVNQLFDKTTGIKYNKNCLNTLKERLYVFSSYGSYVTDLIERINKQIRKG